MKNIWQKLPKPFLVLAPMEDVTDTVFRQIIGGCGKPDVSFTEFTNVEGLLSAGKGVVSQRLQFKSIEKPLIAQIWGIKPESFYNASKYISSLGFDGVDINMGCPEKKVVKNGACGALIKNRKLATEIINAVKEGSGNLPVSVKTRIGYSHIETDDWIGFLLSHNLDALTVHGRTVAEMSEVPAHWDEIGKCVAIRDKISPSTIMIGNGDVDSYKTAMDYIKIYNVDGVMIGRGIFKNPWIFAGIENTNNPQKLIPIMVKHLKLFEKTWGRNKNFAIMKKFYKMYINGFESASDLRTTLNSFTNYKSTITFLEDYLKSLRKHR